MLEVDISLINYFLDHQQNKIELNRYVEISLTAPDLLLLR